MHNSSVSKHVTVNGFSGNKGSAAAVMKCLISQKKRPAVLVIKSVISGKSVSNAGMTLVYKEMHGSQWFEGCLTDMLNDNRYLCRCFEKDFTSYKEYYVNFFDFTGSKSRAWSTVRFCILGAGSPADRRVAASISHGKISIGGEPPRADMVSTLSALWCVGNFSQFN